MAAEVGSLMRLLAGYDKAKGRNVDPEEREKLPDFMRRSGGRLHDLNLPPPPPPPTLLNMLEQPAAARLAAAPAEYQSVCTLESVKSALERLQRPEISRGSTSPASSSTTTSSVKRRPSDDGDGDSTSSPPSGGAAEEMVAAGCPSCLLYVLISLSKPRCPRCDSAVPLPLPGAHKKQKIDLNALSSPSTATTSVPLRTVKFF